MLHCCIAFLRFTTFTFVDDRYPFPEVDQCGRMQNVVLLSSFLIADLYKVNAWRYNERLLRKMSSISQQLFIPYHNIYYVR